jgi:hypothetical protein
VRVAAPSAPDGSRRSRSEDWRIELARIRS